MADVEIPPEWEQDLWAKQVPGLGQGSVKNMRVLPETEGQLNIKSLNSGKGRL